MERFLDRPAPPFLFVPIKLKSARTTTVFRMKGVIAGAQMEINNEIISPGDYGVYYPPKRQSYFKISFLFRFC